MQTHLTWDGEKKRYFAFETYQFIFRSREHKQFDDNQQIVEINQTFRPDATPPNAPAIYKNLESLPKIIPA